MVRQFLSAGDTVIATARRPGEATELRALAEASGDRLHVIEMATDAPASIGRAAQLAAQLTDGLDLLVNNAGVADWSSFAEVEPAALERCFRTNAVGPLLVTRALLPLLRAGSSPLVVNISSLLASLSHSRADRSGSYAYNASKAALNMITALLAHDLKADGITVVAQSPGWVQTDMGGAEAPLLPKASITAQRQVWAALTPADSGRFLGLDGHDLAD